MPRERDKLSSWGFLTELQGNVRTGTSTTAVREYCALECG